MVEFTSLPLENVLVKLSPLRATGEFSKPFPVEKCKTVLARVRNLHTVVWQLRFD